MEEIKVLGISTSPRKGKNTQILLEESLKGCESVNAKTTLVTIYNKNLTPCKGCSVCKKKNRCIFDDDITEITKQMEEADVIFISSPVFFYDVTAQCKMIIDRSYAVQPLNGNKVGGVLVTAGSLGGEGAINTINNFFISQGITQAGYVVTYGDTKENKKGLSSAFQLGVKAVNMAKALKNAPHHFYMHNHFAYGTHTK